ncbi:MAG: hypothetical protein JNL72_09495 [Flavipsychrobacter sp.]|nr:hypothetical protein [Flavipsychrobacter sp.]
MKLRTFALALVALCLTVVANAHPIGKYIRHRNIATADHIYAYDGHGHDKYSRVYKPRGTDKNFYHCSGLGHHVNCKHGSCHHFKVNHHQSRHACKRNCHDHGACKPHSGSSCGHHGCRNVCRNRDYIPSSHYHCADNYVHPNDAHDCGGDEDAVEEVEVETGNAKRAKIKIVED